MTRYSLPVSESGILGLFLPPERKRRRERALFAFALEKGRNGEDDSANEIYEEVLHRV